jgi:hypothetical protein
MASVKASLRIQGGTTVKAGSTPADVIIKREKNGQCPSCGNQTHRLGCFGRRKALTIPGCVVNGMCLKCHPQDSQGSTARKGGGKKNAHKKKNSPRKASPTKKSAAEKFGDVVLQAKGYTGKGDSQPGVFILQAATVQGRPTYKKRTAANYQGQERFLFYTTDGFWRLGTDTAKSTGLWKVKSTAKTPGAITATWTVWDGSADVEVRAAKIVAFQA